MQLINELKELWTGSSNSTPNHTTAAAVSEEQNSCMDSICLQYCKLGGEEAKPYNRLTTCTI